MGEPSPIGVLGIYLDLANTSAPRCQTIAPTASFTNRTWAERVLQYINEYKPAPLLPIPLTTNNIENIMRWNQAENRIPNDKWWGNPTTTYPNRINPLNSGEGPPDGNPLGTYANLDQAASFLAKLLLFGHSWANYGPIITALQDNASAAAFSAAVVQSSFEGTRYGVKAAIDAYNAKKPAIPIPDSAIVPNRGLDYLAQITPPLETPAPASLGKNPSTTNGVGWDWASPQAWQPNPGTTDIPGVPNMSPVPKDLVSIDPTNLDTYNDATGFGQVPQSSGSSAGGPTAGSAGGPIGSSAGSSTSSSTGGSTTGVIDVSTGGTSEPSSSSSSEEKDSGAIGC
jgi:hypothetical protein